MKFLGRLFRGGAENDGEDSAEGPGPKVGFAGPTPKAKSCKAAPASFYEQRHSRRYHYTGRVTLHRRGTVYAISDGTVLDASKSGVRLVLTHEHARRPFDGISIFFNGHTLRQRVQVIWQRADHDGCEFGLRFVPDELDRPVLTLFEDYLCWHSSRRHVS